MIFTHDIAFRVQDILTWTKKNRHIDPINKFIYTVYVYRKIQKLNEASQTSSKLKLCHKEMYDIL